MSMKADQIEVGATYHIHTGRLGMTRMKVTVVLPPDRRNHRMWRFAGINLKTGRGIALKSVGHFVGECTNPDWARGDCTLCEGGKHGEM